MNPVLNEHAWSSEALFTKALLYLGEMERHTANDWQFGLWSSLSLELLARAALASVSPTLLADRRNWRNVRHALGHPPTNRDFKPMSISSSELLDILGELVPEFNKELVDFCAAHCALRNAELHSGEEAFAGSADASWLPKCYATCDVLLRFMRKERGEFFGDSQVAEDMVAAFHDKAAKAVARDIERHKKQWNAMTADEQTMALAQARAWATRHAGHRRDCPACGSPALLHGSGQGPVTTEIRDDLIVRRQTMVPSLFECLACGLAISGFSKVSSCGLGDTFTATSRTSPAEFFGLHTEEELEEARQLAEPAWEEDFNDF